MSNAEKGTCDNTTPCEPEERSRREAERGTQHGGARKREPPLGTKRGRDAGQERGTEGVTRTRVADEQRSRDVNGNHHSNGNGGDKRPLELQQWQQHEQEEEEEEEEAEEEKEEEEGYEWEMLAGADGAELEASRANDGFLEDFAKELDGASCCGEEEEQEDGEDEGEKEVDGAKREREEDDEQVACALQEEEWRRNLPPLRGEFSSLSPVYPSVGVGGDGGCVSSVVCSASSSTSIFDVAGGCGGGGSTSGSIFNHGRFGGGGGGSSGGGAASGFGSGGADGETCDADSGRHSFCNGSTGEESDGHDVDGGGSPKTAAAVGGEAACSSGALPRGGEGAAAGGRQMRGKGKERAVTPTAWPPGGLGEGEGLRINDLPDEIIDNIASFSLLPRCVSKRIERYRVKVVRERVIGALESSAKLPASKAQEVEGAIFALCGNSVTKAYKAKAREMSFNLRVGKNDPLRERLLTGSLLPSDLVRMSSNELAPLSVRRERERLARKRIREVTSSRDSPFHTVTDRFSCQECGHERTQYRTWRRKAVVDRVRVIVQCLQCRHSWEL